MTNEAAPGNGSDLVPLHSLWVGPPLGYLERLCLASAAAVGHELTVWSYEPDRLEGVPAGTNVRDAAEVMPYEKLIRYRDSGAVALGANFWRIELLAAGLGCWVDMDLIFLRPLDFGTPYIFGWEHEDRINNSVMYAPKDSPAVKDLKNLPQPNKRPQWFGPRKSLEFYWQRLRHGRMELEDYPWGTFSAGLLTHVIKKHELDSFVQPPEVFYPIRWAEARSLYGPAEEVETKLSPSTRTVHMWNSRLEGLKDNPPAKGTYMEKVCKEYDVM